MADSQQLFKGSLTTIVLQLLSDNKKMYGYEITKKVEELTGGKMKLTEGALYPALHKLEADGLVTSSLEFIENRQRKYYRITSNGKSGLRDKLAAFTDFVNQVNLILNLKPAQKP